MKPSKPEPAFNDKWKIPKQKRTFPKYFIGMTVAQYVYGYYEMNTLIARGYLEPPYVNASYLAPALYEGCSLDFEVELETIDEGADCASK